MDTKLKERFIYFLGKIDALEDNIYDTMDQGFKEDFDSGKKKFDIVDFAVFDLFIFLLRLADTSDDKDDNTIKDYGHNERVKIYFQELYDTFHTKMSITLEEVFSYLEKKGWRDGNVTDRLELILLTLSCLSNWWNLEDTPPTCQIFLMYFDYEYSNPGNYLMKEFIDILLSFGIDLIACNEHEFKNIRATYKKISDYQISQVKELLDDIESG